MNKVHGWIIAQTDIVVDVLARHIEYVVQWFSHVHGDPGSLLRVALHGKRGLKRVGHLALLLLLVLQGRLSQRGVLQRLLLR